MRSLPRTAQLYLIIIYALGAAVISRALADTASPAFLRGGHVQAWELVLFGVLAALAGGKKIHLVQHKADRDAGSMSLLFPITFAALLRFGPDGGVLVVLVGGLSGGLYPKRQAAHQLFFNLCLAALHTWSAGYMFLALNGDNLALSAAGSFPAIAASCLIYYLLNTMGVAAIIAFCTAQEPFALWRSTFLWTAPSYFAGACIAAIALLMFGDHVGGALLLVSPIAYLIYQSYAITTTRQMEKQQHIEALQENQAHLADLYLATIKSLALAIDAKDQYTHQHILRVQRYAVAIAKQMGLSGNDLEGVNTGALLHDIGKLGVPEYVLLKPGRLTEEEFAKIKKHPEIGAAILDPVEFPWPVLPVVKYHHEKWDGTGYPEGLKGEDIPLTARILSVGDVYDALTSNRSYRNAWTHERAIETITKDAGTHFDPQVVQAFLQIIDGVVADMAREAQAAAPASGDGENAIVPAVPSRSEEAALAINRASSELWALYEVAQTLSSSLGLAETLDILGRKLENILPGTACLFLLKDDTNPDTLLVRTAVGVNRDFFVGARTLSPQSLSCQAARDGQTYAGTFDSDDLLPTSSMSAQWQPLLSALIVPIVHQGEVLGTINLYHPHAQAFGAHDRQLLETISERAAMALYNGLLFDRTRSHAFTDPLTGLYNVRYLTDYVETHCRKDGPAPFALLCLDLDSFKPINDNFGHQKGDQVLCDLSRIFKSCVRETDVVARYGGDEFLIVLHGAGKEEAELMCQRLEEGVTGYDPGLFHPRLGNLRLGVSIGYGCFPADGTDCAGLLSAADSQMYHNKTERKLGGLASRDRAPEPDRTPESEQNDTPRAA